MDVLKQIHLGWARWSILRLCLKYPILETSLYAKGYEFLILVANPPDRFNELSKEFDYAIRPATCSIKLVTATPPSVFQLIAHEIKLEDELWLSGEPSSVGQMNRLLDLAAPNFPMGGIDFLHDTNQHVFRHFGISEDEKTIVRLACKKIGIQGEIVFQETQRAEPEKLPAPFQLDNLLEIPSAKIYKSQDAVLKRLAEKDQDEWRTFIDQRSATPQLQPQKKVFSCLFDANDQSELRISELLTIYDVIHIVPEVTSTSWLDRHSLTLPAVEELVALGRLKLVLPNALMTYPSDLISVVLNADQNALTQSRSLAALSIQNGARKDPLLYGPFSVFERLEILNCVMKNSQDDGVKIAMRQYGQLIEQQHRAFQMRGANACYGVGLGAYLGNLIYHLNGRDARLELSTIGTSIEWAMALQSSFIPRQFGDYDETNNAQIVSSFVNRTKVVPKEPIAERMHSVIDGLLALTNVPPLHVARNLKSLPLQQFRMMANNLVNTDASKEQLQQLVEQINKEVLVFENRLGRLKKFRVQTALAVVAAKPIGDALDAKFGGWTSSFASYSAAILTSELLQGRSRGLFDNYVGSYIDTIIGLTLSPSFDAVITSRTKSLTEFKTTS